MERLFGIPLGALSLALVVLMAAAFGVIVGLALRNRVFFRLGARNVTRRKGRSALIVVGLMLATAIIASSLVTGDTMGRTIRASVLEGLGRTDVVVGAAGAQLDPTLEIDEPTRDAYFPQDQFDVVRDAVDESPVVDGVAPAVIETLAVQNLTARRTEPRATFFASDPDHLDGFDEITVDGDAVSLADLGPDEVYVNDDAVDDLGASVGDRLALYGAAGPTEVEVGAVVSFRGAGAPGPAVLAPLTLAQEAMGEPDAINRVLISNAGDEVSGARHTDEVVDLLDPVLAPLGLESQPVKEDGLELADAQGNAFMALFTTFGSFSIAAGILLIFLVFVMLAAERRTEMGIARAVGTQRGHLVQTFLFEGAVYDLMAAAVGAMLGLGVAYAMVRAVASAFTTTGFDVTYSVEPRSVLVAFGLGVVLTLVVVGISAWRVSLLNIVTAIRNLPAPARGGRRRVRWIVGLGLIAVGVLVAVVGVTGEEATPFLLGTSLVIAGLVPVTRALGIPERTAFTLGGVLLVVWWLVPLEVLEAVVGDLAYDFSVWIVAGLMIVLGATWTVMYNADALLAGVTRLAGRIRALAPIVRMAVVYPLRNRARTAMTLAMFTLLVFTLVTGTAISGSFINSFDDVDKFDGGFDVRGVIAPARPIDDVQVVLEASDELDAADFGVVGGQSMVPAEARQVGKADFADYVVRGLDDAFLTTTTYEMSAVAEGYADADDVWEALASEPNLAVIDGIVAPRRNNFFVGPTPDFEVEGFYIEDSTFEPVEVEVRDPVSGTDLTLTVIGVLQDDAPLEMAGITTSQDTLAVGGAPPPITTYWFALDDGADAEDTAVRLESVFLDHGMEAQSLRAVLDEAVGASWTVNRLIQGFMGLGLVVGVVALGVISARAVVERRRHIGVLRAIGFQPSMVRLSFLAESSVVALTSIVVGTALGLLMARNVVAYAGAQQDVAFVVPWLNLMVIFAVVYAAALGSTYLPARRASRVYPAEALRYE